MSSTEVTHCEALIVGGGPAGLAAATWLGRYRCTTVVLDSCEYRNSRVDQAHGYLGSDPLGPGDLRASIHKDLANYPNVSIVCATARSIARRTGEEFGPKGTIEVATGDHTFFAQKVVLATGTRDEFPKVEGFWEHYGADVFHCPTCDGYEAKGRKVVVMGWNSDVTGFAEKLLNWAGSVTVVAQGKLIDGDREVQQRLASLGIGLREEDAVRLLGVRGALAGMLLQGGETLDCDYVFFSLPEHPVNSLAEQLGCELDETGHVVTDKQGRTSEEGVFAAGDLTPGEQLIQIAAAEGALAGISCATSLRKPPLDDNRFG